MALTKEDREEVVEIIKETIKSYNIDIEFLSGEFKKFKESPEGRLAALEVKVDHLIKSQEGLREELKSEIRGVRSVMVTKDELKLLIDNFNKRFESVDKRLDFQGKLLIWVLGGIFTTIILYGGLIIYLIGRL